MLLCTRLKFQKAAVLALWLTINFVYRIEKQHDTRNHRFALQQSHVHYDMHKFIFSNRTIPIWNSLPDYVVASPTTNTF